MILPYIVVPSVHKVRGRIFLYFKSNKCPVNVSHRKPLEMPDWNLLYLQRIRERGLSVYVFSASKIKSPNLYAKKFGGLQVNNDKIVN